MLFATSLINSESAMLLRRSVQTQIVSIWIPRRVVDLITRGSRCHRKLEASMVS